MSNVRPAQAPRPALPIGEVSRRSGLTVPAIRYYEQRGLVAPLGRAGGRRLFAPDAVHRLRVISEVRKAGFTLDEIRMLLGPGGPGAQARQDLVGGKLAQVRRDIRRLRAIEEALAGAVGCGCDSVEHCGLASLPAAAGAAG